MTVARTRVRFTEVTAEPSMAHEEPEEVETVPKVPKSLQMPRPQKDKQTMGPIHVSPRNPWFHKLSMVEKGKSITIETEEEEEDFQALITQIEVQDDEVEDASKKHSTTKLPPYIPHGRGKPRYRRT